MPTSHPPAELTLRQLVDRGERPFPAHPQVSRYFPAAAIENARRRITRALDRGDGPTLAIGAAGTGKSLLLQVLAAQFQQRFDVVLLSCTRLCTRRALLQAILFELGLPYHVRDEGELRFGLLDHLLSAKQSAAELLLLVDEAQSMPLTLLDELRIMTNLVHNGAPRVRLVLAGSSALEEAFASPELESFSQRLAVRCYLTALSREETAQFVRAQLSASGAAVDEILRPEAWEAVFEATDGVPRLVNQLCDRAISVAAAENCTRIDRRVVQEAWSDLQQLPSPWETPEEAARPTSNVIEFGGLSAEMPSQPASTPAAKRAEQKTISEVATKFEPPRATSAVAPPAVPAKRAAKDPADPFSEDFAEEEVVLDSFAAWSELFDLSTPRVENRHDRGFASLMHAALDASAAASSDQDGLENADREENADTDFEVAPQRDISPLSPPRQPTHEVIEIESWEVTELEPADTFDQVDDADAHWPPIRLADVPSPTWADDELEETYEVAHERPHGEAVPILIVEDDPSNEPFSPPPTSRRPEVRRQEYRRLFSRLRSG